MRCSRLACLAILLTSAGSAHAQSAGRYAAGDAPAAADAGSSNRFSELFSNESSRYSSPPAARPDSGAAGLRPLTPSRATPPSKQPPAATTTAPSRRAAGNAAGRYSGPSSSGATARGSRPPAKERAPVERSIQVNGRREAATHAMLQDMLRAPANSRLTGEPTSLAEAVARAGSREEQGRIVDAYWALASSASDYYLGLAEAVELGRLRQRVPTYSAALSEALVGLNTRVDTSLRAAQAAQFRLSALMGGGRRPLPSDVPFCGPYATRFDQRFPGGGPEEARLLDELLPARLAELQAAADAVERSNRWLAKVAAAGAGGDGAGMIRALELVALNRRAFVQLARDYNLQINRYTQLTTPGERVDTRRLVAMLIRTAPASARAGEALAEGRGLEFRSGGASRR